MKPVEACAHAGSDPSRDQSSQRTEHGRSRDQTADAIGTDGSAPPRRLGARAVDLRPHRRLFVHWPANPRAIGDRRPARLILSPLIRRLRQWGVWRAPSVVLAVVFTLGVLGALGTIIAIQITQLAEELPTYETNLRTKIRALGTGGLTSGALERASGTLNDLQEEIGKAPPRATAGQKPMLVEVAPTGAAWP